jgi:signal transduction histidine kinase
MHSSSESQWAAFLDRLIHDLREPLRAMNAYSQLLTEVANGRLGEEGDLALGEVLQGALRIRTLLDSVSGYSVALRETADSGAASLQLAFNIVVAAQQTPIEAAGATVTGADLPKVAVSLERLMQLLENLIGNALRFRREEPPVIQVTAREQDDGAWLVQVEDNGIGIAAEDCEAVFQPFMRVEGRKYPGAGLGLTICRRIVEAHGGRIWIESVPGQGSICCFTLPAA